MLRLVFLVACLALLAPSHGLTPQEEADFPWWKSTIIYQIYPRSFMDNNGDGIGDIPGIISKLDHFQYLGIETIWLSPFYRSPQKDFGYDISDYRDVDPMFGTIADFRELVKQCKQRGMRVIVDFVPNHTSDQHYWFQQSVKRIGKYTDYYMWTDGITLSNGTKVPPNNWLSVFGGTMWEWNNERQQFYMHQFVVEQPDLNFRNPDVREAQMLNIRYWLDFGIDGLRMDAITNLYEVEDFSLDEPRSGRDVPPTDHDYLLHPYTEFLRPELYEEIRRWQSVLDSKKLEDGKERYMVLEIYTDSKTRSEIFTNGGNPFNLDLVDSVTIPTNASQIMGLIAEEYKNKPADYWPTWVMGNHDRHRVASKYGHIRANGFNMLLLLLKGTPTTYQGEELAMRDITLTYEQSQDPWAINAGPDRYQLVSRDFNRNPMQWTAGPQAGFTTGTPWLPIQQDYVQLNAETEKADPDSPMNMYKDYAALRQVPAFKFGSIDTDVVTNENVLSFTRSYQNENYLVAINLGQNASTDDFTTKVGRLTGVVKANTGYVSEPLKKQKILDLSAVTLQPGEGVVVEL